MSFLPTELTVGFTLLERAASLILVNKHPHFRFGLRLCNFLPTCLKVTNSRVPQLKVVGLDSRLFAMVAKIKTKVSLKLDVFGPFDHEGEVIYSFPAASGRTGKLR